MKTNVQAVWVVGILVGIMLHPLEAISQPWSEYWQQYAFRQTNFSDAEPEAVEQFSLLTTTLRAGYRTYLTQGVPGSSWRAALDVYGRVENVHDFFNERARHANVFNNHVKLGAGGKVRLERMWMNPARKKSKNWLQYLQIDLFSEWQRMETFVERVRFWFDAIEQTNWRSGINAWANSGDVMHMRQETYFDLSFHTTNFSDKGSSLFLILTASPRLFYRTRIFDVYLNGEIVNDILKREPWNRNPFSNNLKLFAGLRSVITLQQLGLRADHALGHASILLFADYARIHYLDDETEWPFYAPGLQLADHDVRLGFVIWWPLGQSTYRPIGQYPF